MSVNQKVTIIMATYNRAHLIGETLASIQNQTYPNWECLIIDDGSSDNTSEVLEGYLNNDNRFKYLQRPDKYQKGLPGCRNYGLDIAMGDYIAFFDDDDIVHPQNLEICIQTIHHTTKDFVLYQKKSFTGKFSDAFKPEELKVSDKVVVLSNVIMNKIPMASCTVFWKNKSITPFRFNEELMYAEEWEFYIRLLINKKQGTQINNVLYFNRKHPNSNTGEFWNNDPIRRKSKVEACRLVIEHLSKNRLMDYELGVYFISQSYFLQAKKVFEYLKANKNVFSNLEWIKLQLRYYLYGIIKPVYKFKKQLNA